MKLVIQENFDALSLWVASYVRRRIIEFAPTAQKPFVLGLPTGGSPIGTYKVHSCAHTHTRAHSHPRP
jgi:glucosamine-6-phosphate deaminase